MADAEVHKTNLLCQQCCSGDHHAGWFCPAAAYKIHCDTLANRAHWEEVECLIYRRIAITLLARFLTPYIIPPERISQHLRICLAVLFPGANMPLDRIIPWSAEYRYSRWVLKLEGASYVSQDHSFGGLNVILCADLHRFLPIACAKSEALYYPVCLARDSDDAEIDGRIYEELSTVVVLRSGSVSPTRNGETFRCDCATGGCSAVTWLCYFIPY